MAIPIQFNINLQKSMDTANNALRKAEDNQSTIESLTSKVEHLSDAVEFLLSENKKQKDNLIRNEVYTRRENLIFRGFNVSKNDSESCEHKVRMILRTMGIPNFDNIPFTRCHYLREQKQIIVRFQWYPDRERVWMNKYKLKRTKFYVSEDFPTEIERERKQLYPVLKAARAIPEYQKKVTMRVNKLVLKGKHYTLENISELPDEIHPCTLAEKSSSTVLVFGGSTSVHHNLSNFRVLKEKFIFEQFSYNSSEQAFQHKKAREANDQNMQREIMFNTDPGTHKRCGDMVKGLDIQSWEKQKRDVMKDILIAKFTQNDDCRRTLLDTGDKILAEANGRDNCFGIGIPIMHPEVLNPDNWAQNGNILGQLLMEIRLLLKS